MTYHVWGEGPDDVGHLDPLDHRDEPGCLDALLEGTVRGEVELCPTRAGYLRRLRKLPGPRKPWERTLKGFSPHAYLATREAVLDGADVVVLGTDTDREAGQRRHQELVKLCHRKRAEFLAGFRRALDDVAGAGVAPSLVRAVPLRKLESWLVADPDAYERVTGRARPPLPRAPEELGGRNDPKRLLETWGADHLKRELAVAADPDHLAKACPASFPPFLDEARRTLRRRPAP